MEQRTLIENSKRLQSERELPKRQLRTMFDGDEAPKKVYVPTEEDYKKRRKMPITGYQLMFPDDSKQPKATLKAAGIRLGGVRLGNAETPNRMYISPRKVHELNCKHLLNQQYATDVVTNTHILNYMNAGPQPARKDDKVDLEILKEEKKERLEKNPQHRDIVVANLEKEGDLSDDEKRKLTELSADYLTELENKHEQPNREEYVTIKESITSEAAVAQP